MPRPLHRLFAAVGPVFALIACGSSSSDNNGFGDPQLGNGDGGKAPVFGSSDGGKGPGGDPSAPTDCATASASKSYLGCEFWPTVTYNPTLEMAFDFTVVVSNPQSTDATVTVSGPSNFQKTVVVKPGTLEKLYLPWVDKLKKLPAAQDGGSVRVNGGAYKLSSNLPVVAYQFNPLEYKAGGASSPAGKDWSTCVDHQGSRTDCFSYSNDASLLLPTNALTGNYRLYGLDNYGSYASYRPFYAITATHDDTKVAIDFARSSQGTTGRYVLPGEGVTAANYSSHFEIMMNAGDVVQLQAADIDLSGSLLKASHPVQVISGVPCIDLPLGVQACDHVEETLTPVETLGKHYFVTSPTGPNGDAPGVLVRIHGNVNGTHLTYSPSKPEGCPDVINAGQSINCGTFGGYLQDWSKSPVREPFEVSGDHEFALNLFQMGGNLVDPSRPNGQRHGDPSQSQAVPVEQFRNSYAFLAPDDYAESFVDVMAPGGTALVLDGAAVTAAPTAMPSGYQMYRIPLTSSAGGKGAHAISGDKPFGIQVVGYGAYTSYQYPGGLNLGVIASVPVTVQ